MNLISKLVREIVRNELLIEAYRKIPQGVFTINMIGKTLNKAYDSIESNETEEVIKSIKELEANE